MYSFDQYLSPCNKGDNKHSSMGYISRRNPIEQTFDEGAFDMRRWFFPMVCAFFCGWIFLLISCGNTVQAQSVQVTLTDDRIASSLTTFDHNTPYHFVIVNKGTQQHEFMIMPPMRQMNISMDEMDKMSLAHISAINPGENRVLDYTFTQAESPGKLEFACHIADHYQRGMHLGIVIR